MYNSQGTSGWHKGWDLPVFYDPSDLPLLSIYLCFPPVFPRWKLLKSLHSWGFPLESSAHTHLSTALFVQHPPSPSCVPLVPGSCAGPSPRPLPVVALS